MTTFTTDDREEAYKGYEDAVPIPFAGWVNTAPPHVVDSGASVMLKELTDEEIQGIYHSLDSTGYEGTFSFIEFARAVLRKAQEK